MVEGTEWYSICCRCKWLRAVLPVKWPEKAGLFSMQSLWELKYCPCSQMAQWDLTQEKPNIIAITTTVPFKEQLQFMFFSDTQSSNSEETDPSSLCLLPFLLKCGICKFSFATRGQQENSLTISPYLYFLK